MHNEMLASLNKQINAEFYSSYLYLSMASFFESINLKGFAQWMYIQSQEETTHGMKIYNYLIDRRAAVTFTSIDAPESVWQSAFEVFKTSLAHEIKVTAMINNLVETAIKHKDHETFEFLQWFVKEQVEEEKNADEILQTLKMIGNDMGALLSLDRELSKRT